MTDARLPGLADPVPRVGLAPGSGIDLATVDLAALTGALGNLLHAAGVPVTPERCGRFAEAITLARPASVDELAWLGRVTMVADHDQALVFDRVFAQVFRGQVDIADTRGDSSTPAPPETCAAGDRRPSTPDRDDQGAVSPGSTAGAPGGAGSDLDPSDDDALLAAASDLERLRATVFASLTEDELEQLRALLAELPLVPPERPGRRRHRHPAGRQPDLRATLRRAHRTGGDPVRQVLDRERRRPRRLVLLADVSGSMEPYARAYLHLLHGAVRSTRAEAFVFATRLTRLTRALAVTDPELALQRAASAAPDWSGGTRIGAAIQAFNDGYGRRGMAHGAIVVIVSDGWERADPALLGREMARLARLAHAVVWVNPRRAAERYQPLAGGMAAALPHVDAFVSGHSLGALDEVLAAIRSAGSPTADGRRAQLTPPSTRRIAPVVKLDAPEAK